MNNPQTTFAEIFNSVESTTEFNPEWKNLTGYLDYIVDDQSMIAEMNIGERVKFEDDIGRRAIGVKTRHGIVVVFERYSPEGDKRSNVIVSNAPYAVRPLLKEGALTDADIYRAVSQHGNVAHLVERVCGDGNVLRRRRTA